MGVSLDDLIAPDGTLLAASFGEISGRQDVRVLSVERLRAGDAAPAAIIRPSASTCAAHWPE